MAAVDVGPPSEQQIQEDTARAKPSGNRGESVKDRNRKAREQRAREVDARIRAEEEKAGGGPQDHYLRQRGEGRTHEEACESVLRAYDNPQDVHADAFLAAYERRLEMLTRELEKPQNGHAPALDVFDAFEIEAREKVAALEQRERDLALRVVEKKDADAERELKAVQCELHDAQDAIRTAQMARDEHVVQQRRQQAEADEKHKEMARQNAAKLAPRVTAQAEALDKLADEYAAKLSSYYTSWRQHREALAAAGANIPMAARPTPAITGALLFALEQHRGARMLIDFNRPAASKPLTQ